MSADLELPPVPDLGALVRLHQPIGAARSGFVVATGDCGWPRCGAGDRCCTIRLTEGKFRGQTVNRTPTDFDVVVPE